MTPDDPTRLAPPDEASRTMNIRAGGSRIGSTDFAVGSGPRRLFGDYELLAEVGRGGMGRVYKARQRSMNRTVALKTILAGQKASPALIQRFKREAESAAQLDHPGIVRVYDFAENEGQYYFTMAFVDGRALDQRLKQGPLDPRMAALIVQKVAEAVDYAHSRGVVHRDLKPGNVLLARDGAVKVTDFGLARRMRFHDDDDDIPTDGKQSIHEADTAFRLTLSGTIMGTPGFMAPEQGRDASAVGPPADIWALGALLYACLTGRPPFVGDTAAKTLALAIETDPDPPSSIVPTTDPELEAICMRCLEKKPRDRYPSAAAMAADLQRWRQDHAPRGRATPWHWRVRQFVRETPEFLPIAAGLIAHRLGNIQEGLLLGFMLAGMGWARRRSDAAAWPILTLLLGIFASLGLAGGWIAEPWRDAHGLVLSAAGIGSAAAVAFLGLNGLKSAIRRQGLAVFIAIGMVGTLVAALAYLFDVAWNGGHGIPAWARETDWRTHGQTIYIVATIVLIIAVAGSIVLGFLRLVQKNMGEVPHSRTIMWFGAGVAVLAALAASAGLIRQCALESPADPGSSFAVLVGVLNDLTGRWASWLLAVPMGAAIGVLLGHAEELIFERHGHARPRTNLAFAAGAAAAGLLALWIAAYLDPEQPAAVGVFSFTGPGPLLAYSEWLTGHEPAQGVAHAHWTALPGIACFKVLLLALPMTAGGLAGRGISTLASPEGRS